MNIIMYTRTNPPCSFCQMAKQFAENKKIPFQNIEIGKDITHEEFQEKFPSTRTVPLILDDDFVIGGFAEFGNYVLSKELREMSI
jgi:glutaredoxin